MKDNKKNLNEIIFFYMNNENEKLKNIFCKNYVKKNGGLKNLNEEISNFHAQVNFQKKAKIYEDFTRFTIQKNILKIKLKEKNNNLKMLKKIKEKLRLTEINLNVLNYNELKLKNKFNTFTIFDREGFEDFLKISEPRTLFLSRNISSDILEKIKKNDNILEKVELFVLIEDILKIQKTNFKDELFDLNKLMFSQVKVKKIKDKVKDKVKDKIEDKIEDKIDEFLEKPDQTSEVYHDSLFTIIKKITNHTIIKSAKLIKFS